MTLLIIEPIKEMLMIVGVFIPKLLTVFFILILGYITAHVIRKLVFEICKVIHFDKIMTSMGLTKVLENADIKHKPSYLLSILFYTVMMVVVLMVSVKPLGFTMVSVILGKMFAYIPSVISGVMALIIGMLLAKFVASLVYITAKNTDMPRPEILSRLSKLAILVYVSVLYLREIGFVSIFEGTNYTIFLSGIVLSLALAFGLAGRNIASKYLEVFNVKKNTP